MDYIIIHNSARCRKCGDVIESHNRHDFVNCKCGAIAVDGGKDYLRRVGNPIDFDDLSETEPLCRDCGLLEWVTNIVEL